MAKQKNMYVYFEEKYRLSLNQIREVFRWIEKQDQNTFLEYWGVIKGVGKIKKKDYLKTEKNFCLATSILLISNRHELPKEDVLPMGLLMADIFRIDLKGAWNPDNSSKYDAKYFVECMEQYITEKERYILQRFYGFSGEKKSIKEIARKLNYSPQWTYECLRKAKNKLLGKFYSDQGFCKFRIGW